MDLALGLDSREEELVARNINQDLADQLLATQLDLLRLEAGARNDAFKLLTQMESELVRRLRSQNLTQFNRARTRSLIKQLQSVIDDYYARIDDASENWLSGTARVQANSATDALDNHFVSSVDASVPPTSVMKAMAGDTLVMGAPSSEWWERQSKDLQFRFANIIRSSVIQGDTMDTIVAKVRGSRGYPGIMDAARQSAKALVHTSIMEVASEARLATYKENNDIIEGIQQVSTLDSHTTDICIAYDGAQFTLDGEPLNGTNLPYNGGVPRHWGCRSVEVPITKTFKELGIDAPEPKEGERASADGPVKANTTFDEFLTRMGKDFQDETLGEGRAELWRDGKITLQQLLDLRGNPLTLDELEAKYA